MGTKISHAALESSPLQKLFAQLSKNTTPAENRCVTQAQSTPTNDARWSGVGHVNLAPPLGVPYPVKHLPTNRTPFATTPNDG